MFGDTVVPSEVGQRVRLVGYGGNVRSWMAEAGEVVVVRFARTGSPVLRLSGSLVTAHTGKAFVEVSDTFGVARVVDDDGQLARAAL